MSEIYPRRTALQALVLAPIPFALAACKDTSGTQEAPSPQILGLVQEHMAAARNIESLNRHAPVWRAATLSMWDNETYGGASLVALGGGNFGVVTIEHVVKGMKSGPAQIYIPGMEIVTPQNQGVFQLDVSKFKPLKTNAKDKPMLYAVSPETSRLFSQAAANGILQPLILADHPIPPNSPILGARPDTGKFTTYDVTEFSTQTSTFAAVGRQVMAQSPQGQRQTYAGLFCKGRSGNGLLRQVPEGILPIIYGVVSGGTKTQRFIDSRGRQEDCSTEIIASSIV